MMKTNLPGTSSQGEQFALQDNVNGTQNGPPEQPAVLPKVNASQREPTPIEQRKELSDRTITKATYNGLSIIYRWTLLKPVMAVASGFLCGAKAIHAEYTGDSSDSIAALSMQDLTPRGIKNETEKSINKKEQELSSTCISSTNSTALNEKIEKLVEACEVGGSVLKGLRSKTIPGYWEIAERKRDRPEDFNSDTDDDDEKPPEKKSKRETDVHLTPEDQQASTSTQRRSTRKGKAPCNQSRNRPPKGH